MPDMPHRFDANAYFRHQPHLVQEAHPVSDELRMNPDDDPYGEKDGTLPEDYRFTAKLLRLYASKGGATVPGGIDAKSLFQAVCSNNLDIILAALDSAGTED